MGVEADREEAREEDRDLDVGGGILPALLVCTPTVTPEAEVEREGVARRRAPPPTRGSGGREEERRFDWLEVECVRAPVCEVWLLDEEDTATRRASLPPNDWRCPWLCFDWLDGVLGRLGNESEEEEESGVECEDDEVLELDLLGLGRRPAQKKKKEDVFEYG